METSGIDLLLLRYGWKGIVEIEEVGKMDVSDRPYYTFLRHIADTLAWFTNTVVVADENLRKRVTVISCDEKLLKVRIAPETQNQ